MAWAVSATTFQMRPGWKRVVFGTATQVSGDTGGTITAANHGLRKLDWLFCTWAKNIALSGTTATITTADPVASITMYWMAVGT